MFVFVIMPFRENFSEVYEEIIKPVLLEEGCEVVRADEFNIQRNVLRDIVKYLEQADLVVADLTLPNINVYYELGLAHAFLKPTLIITQDTEDLPFDLRTYRAHKYSLHFKVAADLKKQLRQVVQAHKNGRLEPHNPVSDFLPHYRVSFDPTDETPLRDNLEPQQILEQARSAYFDKNDYEQALLLAEQVLDKWPNNGRARQVAGMAAHRLGKLEKAIAHGAVLREREPTNADGYSILADAYMDMGEWEKAIPLLEYTLKYTTPTLKAFTYNRLARVHEKLGDLDQAIEAYETAAELFERFNSDAYSRAMAQVDADRLRGYRDTE